MTDRPEHLLPFHMRWPAMLQDRTGTAMQQATPYERDSLLLLKSIDNQLKAIRAILEPGYTPEHWIDTK